MVGQGDLVEMIHRATRCVDVAYSRLQNAETMVYNVESKLNVKERWEPSSPEYQEIKKEVSYRVYRRALDELEWLVVQRLFELTKLNMSGTGMRWQSDHIVADASL
jgi:hypothetical protein